MINYNKCLITDTSSIKASQIPSLNEMFDKNHNYALITSLKAGKLIFDLLKEIITSLSLHVPALTHSHLTLILG